ncbi:hypothetical protein [Dyella sp. M7H15-1]|nr:hypothetical protein [Dyella sp. M7H15-1]
MDNQGIQFDGMFSPWMRFCMGVAIVIVAMAMLLLASTPLVNAIRWW